MSLYKQQTDIAHEQLTGKHKELEKVKGKASFRIMKEVTISHILSTIEFCAEIYLQQQSNQSRVQKKLNLAMRLLLHEDTDPHVANMLTALDWLNLENMWHWCCIYTLKRIISNLSQTLHND